MTAREHAHYLCFNPCVGWNSSGAQFLRAGLLHPAQFQSVCWSE